VELRWEKDDFHDHIAPFSGKWYHTESAINEPRYRNDIPVMLGGSGEKKTFRLAARSVASVFNPIYIHAPRGGEEKGTCRATASRPLWCGD